MRVLAVAALLLVAGCAGTGTGSAQTHSAGTTPGAVNFACRLPFLLSASAQPTPGFVSLPAGTFQPDSTAGRTVGYYDAALSKWLPVDRRAVSPDGQLYATTTEGIVDKFGSVQAPATLNIVTAATGAVRTIALTNLRPQAGTTALFLEVIDVEPDAVYGLERGQAGLGELYRVDLTSGALSDVYGAQRPEAVGFGAFWFGAPDPNAPGAGAAPADLRRWDLQAHSTSVWFSRASAEVYLIGFDHKGAAVVLVIDHGNASGSTEIWTVSQPGSETRIYAAPTNAATPSLLVGMVADNHGLWFGAASGVFFYSASTGFRKVSDVAGLPANGCA